MALKYTPKVIRVKKNEEEKKSLTTAGAQPAVGVSASNSVLNGAKSFAEYSALRRKQEEEDGMRSAADKLAGQYGYKKVGNKVVFATPTSPLPAPTKENTATRAQAPGAYGIDPKDYAEKMTAVNRYVNRTYDKETQAFLDRYFKGQLPTEEEFDNVFKHYARGGVETEHDVMNFHRGAELVRKATEEKNELLPAYEEAIAYLGEDAVKYLSQNESDYYERFGNTYGAADVLNSRTEKYNPKTQAFLDQYFDGKMPTEEEYRAKLAEYAAGGVENEADVMNLNAGAYLLSEGQKVKGAGSSDAMTLEEAEKYNMTQFANLGNDRFDLRRWSQTTPEERAAYQLMEKYGYADEYLRSLEPELNKRIAEVKTAEAAQFAEEKPFWANVSSVVKAPMAGLGALEMGANKLMGKEIDLYDPRLTIARQNEAIREQTASGMSGVGKFFYNTGMSIADNVANMLAWGGLGSFATSLSMGGSSAASAFTSAVERGANEKQALTAALVSGVAETLFEKFSLDNVIEMSKGNKLGSHVLNVLKQMGIEGSEEFATGLANEIADRAIMGDLSNYELLVDYYVKQGLMEDVARRKAEWSSAGEIGLGTLGGMMSGGVMGTGGEIIGSMRNRNVQAELDAAAKALAEAEKQQTEEAPVPAPVPAQTETATAEEKQQEALMQEYEDEASAREQEREYRENAREYKQDEQQQPKQPADEQEQMQEEKPVKTPENAENVSGAQTLDSARSAKVTDDDGNEHSVRVVGVESVTDGEVVLKLEDENGEEDYSLASEVRFEGPEGELLASKGVERLDAKGVRNYLQNYDQSIATPEEYARAFNEVYQRGNAGLTYEQAAMQNQNARTYLNEDARMAAYAAGLNAYNQTHERVQPATVGKAQGETRGNVQLSAKDTAGKGGLSRQYTQTAYRSLGKKGQKKTLAQMELLNAIASRTGRRIVLVDSIVGKNGKKANALYDTKTGEIRVALDADVGAYAYAAMHELTHAIKNEYASEWDGFVTFVKDGLSRNKQSWEQLVKYQMDQFGYSRAAAEEEVICNTVPALLQDESNVLRLYKNNRKLFDRVVDWVKTMLNDVKAAGKALSGRSKSWAQMDALAGDRELLQGMYDRLMKVMEKPGESNGESEQIKFSLKETEKMSWEQQVDQVESKTISPSAMLSPLRSCEKLSTLFGIQNVAIGCKISDLRKIIRPPKGAKSGHSIDANTIKLFKKELETPKVVFENAKRNSLYVVTGLKDADNNPIVMVVVKDQTDGHGQPMHQMISAYGMVNPTQYMLDHLESGSRFYYENEKTFIQHMSGSQHIMDASDVHEMKKRYTIIINDADEKVKFSMSDSEGNDLTEEQQEYFADSKVRDDEGRLLVMYHGTTAYGDITKFKPGKKGWLGPGIYLTNKKNDAQRYADAMGPGNGKMYTLYANVENPLYVYESDPVPEILRAIFGNDRAYNTRAAKQANSPSMLTNADIKKLQAKGYDGIVWKFYKSVEVSVFKPEQVKSVENKTPTESPDIRYSMSDVDDNVREAVNAQQKAFELVKGHRITAAEADKLAGTILRKANSDYDRQRLAAEISRIYDFVERGEDVDMRQIEDEMTDLMARVMAKSKALDMEHEEMAKPIREYLRTTPIAMTAAQMKEAESLAGSYGAFRKSMFGRVRLSNLGRTKLDTAWQELSEMNPELFPPDAREGDMPALLQKAVDALKPVYNTGMGMGEEESANWLAGQMNEAYFALPGVKAAASNAKEFAGNVEAMNKAMKRFEETSWSEYQNALEGIKQARGEQAKTQKQKETAALRKKYENWRDRDTAQRKERELKAKYRVKIERTANTLMNWMQKPTDAKHVPPGVEDSLRRMLESLDFSGKTTKTAEDLSAKINGLADALLHAQEGEDESRTIFLERDQQMIDELRRMAEIIRGNAEHNQREGRGVYELNGLELKELSKWLDVVKHVVTEASKLRGSNLPGESVEQVAAMSMQEMSGKKALKDKKWIGQQWHEYFGPDMQDSFSFFERLGPTANAIFMELRKGFDKVTELTRKAEQYTKTILDGAKLKELTGKKAKEYTFNLAKGGTVKMTKANIMELYVLSRREQAQSHLYGGGIRMAGDKDARPHVLTKADVKAITDTLTADEKRIAEGMQQFLSRECASWGNETSVKLLGYKKFGEEFYWPIRTDSNSRNTTKLEDNFAANISAIKNQGMTKQTVENASNPIMIGDIFDTYTKHISNMAAYSAYALPLSDFTRWYNSRGVKTEIEQMMGQKGLKYINNFLVAVNGSSLQADQGGLERLTGKLTRNAKVASVGFNVRVAIQQPTSYARAAMYMSPKYLSLALAKKARDIELINKYCGIAQWKNWGFYETNIGPNLRQMVVGDDGITNKAREASGWLAGKGDEWTIKHLWNACELETQDVYPELEVGSDAYFKQVGERLSELIDRTQVVDSVFHRSQLMRSKSGTAQMLTNFMSEPTKTFNMLMSAIDAYAENRKNKAARNRVARAFAVYAATGILTAAAAAVIDAFRDDDAEKDWLEKYVGAVGSNTADNLNPLGMMPVVKDVLSMLEGYEPSRMDTQSIQRIVWSAQEVQKYVDGTSKQNAYGVIYKIAQAASSTLGVPLGNFMRDGNAIWQTVTGRVPTLTAEAQKSSTVNRMYRMLMEGNKAEAKKLREQLQIKAGLTPKQIDERIAEKLLENELIAKAWKAKSERNYADMNRIKNQLTGMGFAGEAVEKAIVRYGEKQKPKEEKPKDPGEQLSVTLYSEEEVVNAMRVLAGLEKGNVTEADVRAMISERVSTSKAKDPEKTVKSNIQGELKKTYLEMEAKGNTNGMKRLGMIMKNLLKTDEDTMTGWVKDAHAEQLREAVDSYNSGNAAKAVAKMRADGKTDSQIKSSLSKYKQLYIDAIKRNDKVTANKIKRMLQSLGLKGTKGKDLYSDSVFEDWLKEK